jgi:hypothetical protein
MHKHWVNIVATKSSTWRKVKAIELSIDNFKHLLRNSSVTFFTDNQHAACIIKKGSKIPELETLALSIYSICVSCNSTFPYMYNGFQWKKMKRQML